jgi:hypothetical protein
VSTGFGLHAFETSLGPVAQPGADHWSLDLSDLPIFRGLSVLSRALTEQVVAQALGGSPDVNVERELSRRENPELLSDLSVVRVHVRAEQDVLAVISRDPRRLGDSLRAVFGTLQQQRYREALFAPAPGAPSSCLVFEFGNIAGDGEQPCRMLLELLRSSQGGILRVTMENPRGRRLDLTSIPHVHVTDMDRRTFISGSTRIAQTWREGLRREAQRGREVFVDRRVPGSHLFEQLDLAGLSRLTTVNISWGERSAAYIIDSDAEELTRLLKKILLALEDRHLRNILSEGQVLGIDLGGAMAYLDLSQHSRVLNVSLDRPRDRMDIGHFLDLMPATADLASAGQPLSEVKVFLIHHITSEVLGLIAALRRLGCRDLCTVFVAYAGDAPSTYLEPLLSLPVDEFTAYALTSVPREGRIEGVYRLSSPVFTAATGLLAASHPGSRRAALLRGHAASRQGGLPGAAGERSQQRPALPRDRGRWLPGPVPEPGVPGRWHGGGLPGQRHSSRRGSAPTRRRSGRCVRRLRGAHP